MINDLDFGSPNLLGSVVFRSTFNSFETINATQAWSLLFTGGKEDKTLGFSPQFGLFLTNVLLAITASGIAGALVFQSSFIA